MYESKEQIRDKMLANMPDTYQKTVGFPTYDLLSSIAITGEYLSLEIKKAVDMFDVDNLEADILAKFIEQRTGIKRNNAVAAKAVLTATTSGECLIPRGTIFETEGGIQFFANKDTFIPDTSGNINITACIAGESGNVAAKTITIIPISISGLISVINETPAKGGYNAETDTALRLRYYMRLREPIVTGNKNYYKALAMSVPGVGAAKVFPLARGDNTVEVCIIGNDGRPADSSLIERTQKYIDPGSKGKGEGEAPMGAYCFIITATTKDITISADLILLPDNELENVTQLIKKNVSEYLKSNAFIQDYVSFSEIAAVIHKTEGVSGYENLKVNGANIAVKLTEKEVAQVGAVEFNVKS